MVYPKQPVKGPQLPRQQLAILAIARFAEPVALTSVFPYLPEMIQSFGVEENRVAEWAGFTSAIFSISQSCFAIAWGRASDHFGRKPIILCGLVSTMLCFIMWGVSTSLPMAITVRALMGAGNGNVGIIRTMVAELVQDKELQPVAFSIMPLVWAIGSVFGPAFGGFFVRPADRFPGVFGNSDFFKKYPFSLPNIIACIIFFVSFMTGLLFLQETLHSKRQSRDWGLRLGEKLARLFRTPSSLQPDQSRLRRKSLVDAEATLPLLPDTHPKLPSDKHALGPPGMAEIFTKQTCITLLAYTVLAIHSVAYDQVLPVFLNYPRQRPDEQNTQLPFRFASGFGLGSGKIGTIFTVYGLGCGLAQFLIFPFLCARFGVLSCFRASAIGFPIIYLITPYTAIIPHDFYRYTFFMGLMLMKGVLVIVGFPCMTILLTNSASSLRILGTLNGFVTSFGGLGRALGPAMTGSSFSWGVSRGYMITPWWLLAGVSLLGAIPCFWVVEGDGPGKDRHDDERERDEEEDEHDVHSLAEEDGFVDRPGYGTMVASKAGRSSLA